MKKIIIALIILSGITATNIINENKLNKKENTYKQQLEDLNIKLNENKESINKLTEELKNEKTINSNYKKECDSLKQKINNMCRSINYDPNNLLVSSNATTFHYAKILKGTGLQGLENAF